LRSYRREWLRSDLLAGLVVWSVVTPQAVAYAQVAGLPPEAGLVAAPGALIGYALLGSSPALIVSATTSTAAFSAAVVGPLAHGDAARFAAFSAALAIVAAIAFAGAGALRLGGVTDLISKPVLTGFLFGLGLFVTVGQLPALLGVEGGSGQFFSKLGHVLGELGDAQGATVAVGLASIAGLVALRRFAPRLPGTLIVLALAIVISALLNLDAHGVDVVGALPNALPDPSLPDVGWNDIVDLIPAGVGIIVLSTEGIGVARALASQRGYAIDVNREFYGLGGANLLAGLSSGFVQAGGASQTAAAQTAGGKSQMASVVAALLVLLTGAVLAPLFEQLPEATLAAMVIVAVTGFYRVGELRRYASLRRSAIAMALVALGGVLVLGVLPGLILAAGLSLVLLVRRLSRPPVQALARDPDSGAWGTVERHPGWEVPRDAVVARIEGPLFYANTLVVKDHLLALARDRPARLVLELDKSELDVEGVDMLGELADALAARSVELRLASVRVPVRAMLERGGVAERVVIAPTLDAALERPPGVGVP
jgi:MFS superfamily sulfate permease-like transporter